MLTGYLSTLPTDCLLSAGVLFYTKAATPTRIGVTDGAPDFDPGAELGEIMFDNRPPSRLKGLARRVGFQPVIKGTLKELGPSASGSQILLLEPGSTEATVSGTTTENPKLAGALFAAGDYIADFRWAFERASGGYAVIYAPLAIVRKWTMKGNDKKEAAIAFEIEAVGDPVNDLSTAPYTIEIRTQLPTSLISDSFNRANSATSLSASDTGQAWTAVVGTWGINANQAYVAVDAGAGTNLAVLDSGVANCSVQVTFSAAENGMGVAVRETDGNNYFLLLRATSTSLQFYRIQAGVATLLNSSTPTMANGDVFRVTMAANNFSIFRNGVLEFTTTDSFQTSATKHGLADSTGIAGTERWDDFSVTVP